MIIDEISANELERQAFRRWKARHHPHAPAGYGRLFWLWREARRRQAERQWQALLDGLNPEKMKTKR